MTDCGHACCRVPSNRFHEHLDKPWNCRRCAEVGGVEPMSAEAVMLGRLIDDVLTRVAPEIPGLPTGVELEELVSGLALAVFAGAVTDPEIMALPERDRRTVLAGRVGLDLAFPPARP